jgi:hypothetical protein
MSFRTTSIWLAIAAVLFAFIFFYQRHARVSQPSSRAISFPNIDPAEVTSVQVRPGSELEILAVRTNISWRLVEPFEWPAQALSLETFLSTLAKARPVAVISPAEVRSKSNAQQEYGFDSPQASIILRQGSNRLHMLIGGLTAPGDQFFLQVVGTETVFVFNADLLKIIPKSINDWRDTALVDLNRNPVDSVSVTSGGKVFTLQRDPSKVWSMAFPIKARADQARIHDALERTHSLRVLEFISDDPTFDLEPLGLQPPRLQVSLAQGTNPPTLLLFGRSPTNNSTHVFATRSGWKTAVTVAKQFVEVWENPVFTFRDPYLLSNPDPVQSVVVSGKDPFHLEWQPSGGWRVAPSNWPGDPDLAREFIARLNGLRIVQFVKDVVTEPDLPGYGLDSPAISYQVRYASPPNTTNQVELQFGASQDATIFSRRTDETSIYAISTNDFHALPSAPWQLRERKLWNFPMEEVKRVTVRTDGRVRSILRQGPQSWQLEPGSQGVINDLAVDETVRGLSTASFDKWVALGTDERGRFGISDTSFQLVIEFKDGRTSRLEFGDLTPSQGAYAAVNIDGLVWIGEFPWILCRDVSTHLAPPMPAPK